MNFARTLVETAIVGLVVTSVAFALTEREAVLRALESSAEIQTIRIDRASDSLTSEMVEAGWLPAVGLSAGVSASTTGADGLPNSENRSISGSAAASVRQVLPGGGAVDGSVSQSSGHVTTPIGDGWSSTNGYSLGYTQPLVRNAWRFGEQDYTVRIRRLDRQVFLLWEKKKLLELVSSIRKLYWNAHAATGRLGIRIAEVDYAQRRLATERQRLMVGSGTSLDTLSALLELLKAQQGHLDAEIASSEARRNLALALNTSTESLVVDTTAEVRIGEIPPPAEFIDMSQKFDPQLKIFETLHAKNQSELARARNQFLPQVDFSARLVDESGPSVGSLSLIASYALPVRSLKLAKQQQELRVAANQVGTDSRRRVLLANIQAFSEQWEQDKRRVEIAIMTEDVARRNMLAFQTRYDLGSVDNLALIDARNKYTSAALGRIQAEIELKKIEIDVQEITGASLSEFGVTWE